MLFLKVRADCLREFEGKRVHLEPVVQRDVVLNLVGEVASCGDRTAQTKHDTYHHVPALIPEIDVLSWGFVLDFLLISDLVFLNNLIRELCFLFEDFVILTKLLDNAFDELQEMVQGLLQ